MELLVVIAIIGILASVVLASLNSARNKGGDASVKSNLNNMRSQAEIYYDDNTNSYNGVCALVGANTIGAGVRAAEAAYDNGASTYADATASTFDNAQCHDDPNAWVAWVPVKASTVGAPRAWCVDSTGNGKLATAVLGSSAMVCP